jgi:hypothetical protein
VALKDGRSFAGDYGSAVGKMTATGRLLPQDAWRPLSISTEIAANIAKLPDLSESARS